MVLKQWIFLIVLHGYTLENCLKKAPPKYYLGLPGGSGLVVRDLKASGWDLHWFDIGVLHWERFC